MDGVFKAQADMDGAFKAYSDMDSAFKAYSDIGGAWRLRLVMDSESMSHNLFTGTQSIFVKTWGCSHNNSDGEYMAGQLAAYGYKITGKYIAVSVNVMLL